MTRCELRGGSLNSIEGPTLQQPSVAEEIRMDARMGVLKLVAVHKYVFRSFHVHHNWRTILWKPSGNQPTYAYSLLYVGISSSFDFELDWAHRAFSIRIAVSLNGRIEKAIARGWEDIPGIIAEIESQHSVWVNMLWLSRWAQWILSGWANLQVCERRDKQTGSF